MRDTALTTVIRTQTLIDLPRPLEPLLTPSVSSWDAFIVLRRSGNPKDEGWVLSAAHPLHRSGSHLVAYSLLGGQRQAQLPFPMELKDI